MKFKAIFFTDEIVGMYNLKLEKSTHFFKVYLNAVVHTDASYHFSTSYTGLINITEAYLQFGAYVVLLPLSIYSSVRKELWAKKRKEKGFYIFHFFFPTETLLCNNMRSS